MRGIIQYFADRRAANVDFDVGRRDRQTVDSDERDAPGSGGERRPLPLSIEDVGTQCEREIDVLGRKAHRIGGPAIKPDEGIDVRSSNQQLIDECGFRFSAGSRTSRFRQWLSQCDFGGRLVEVKPTGDLKEAGDIQIHVPFDARHWTGRTVHVQRDARIHRRPRSHIERIGEEVDERAVDRPTRDLDVEVRAARFKHITAEKDARFRSRFESQPLPIGRVLSLVLSDGEAELHAGQSEANHIRRPAIQPGERRHLSRADGQQIDLHSTRVIQRDLLFALPKREVAGKLREASHVEIGMRRGRHDLSL